MIHAPQEIQSIAASVDRLIGRLRTALNTERMLAMQAAHELRTPLTALRLRLDNASVASSISSAGPEIEAAKVALNKLQRRSEMLLQLSRSESASTAMKEVVEVGALVTDVIDELLAAEGPCQHFSYTIPDEPVWAIAEPDALAICVRNLIENALRHTALATVDVTVTPDACITITDRGPGIPIDIAQWLEGSSADQDRPESNLRGPGAGLGLSIVRSISRKNGIAIHANSRTEMAGTSIVLTLSQPVRTFDIQTRAS